MRLSIFHDTTSSIPNLRREIDFRMVRLRFNVSMRCYRSVGMSKDQLKWIYVKERTSIIGQQKF